MKLIDLVELLQDIDFDSDVKVMADADYWEITDVEVDESGDTIIHTKTFRQ